jgi:hypothetical protein
LGVDQKLLTHFSTMPSRITAASASDEGPTTRDNAVLSVPGRSSVMDERGASFPIAGQRMGGPIAGSSGRTMLGRIHRRRKTTLGRCAVPGKTREARRRRSSKTTRREGAFAARMSSVVVAPSANRSSRGA